MNYKVYETDAEGKVVVDAEGNPVETDEYLLLNDDGSLKTTMVEGGKYAWEADVIDRFVELYAYKLIDAVEKEEEQINPDLVDREDLEIMHDENNAERLYNRGQDTVNGKTYTKYQQGNKMYYYDAETGKFYTLKETTTPAEVQTVSQLASWALILIIAGAAIAVIGIAVSVVMVTKSKNKPVAADDVAAEGEVQVIDETAGSDDNTSNE